jgi:pimeloyl-ACP methyl ester carboxylesterase
VVGAAQVIQDEGSGPAVVLLHGWPVTPSHWRHVIPPLLDTHHRVLTVVTPGLAGGRDVRTTYAKEAVADAVLQALDGQGLTSFALIGHDWGATVAYLLAADNGGRVSALVAEEEIPPGVATGIPEPGRSHYPTWHGPFLRSPGLAEALLPGREDAFHRAFLNQSAGRDPLEAAVLDEYVAAYRGEDALAATLGYYRSVEADIRAVRRRAASPLATPTLTVGGELAMGTAVRDAFGSLARQVQHVQVPNAGHYPLEQAPVLVLPTLTCFLSQHV